MASTYNKDPLGYYEDLDVAFDDSDKIIKSSYRDRAKEWHPDYNDSPEALERFQKISVAYETLIDEKTRLMYDMLALVYGPQNFPDMFALKTFKNKKGKEDTDIKVLIFKNGKKETKEICNYGEAKLAVFKNYILNIWNIPATIYNFKNLDKHYDENLCLMVHNAVASLLEDNKENAYIFATRGLEYADDYQSSVLQRFIKSLKIAPKIKRSNWNFKVLKSIYLSVPALILLACLLPYSSKFITDTELNSRKEINYYQEVRFRTGGETVDDVVVSKVVSFPVDVTDYGMLYRTTAKVPVMYGPSEDFDVITHLEQNHTVRVTGVSPDKVWFRIMLDNGDMGFVPTKYLKAGIGNKIPDGSKIFRQP